MARIIGLMQDKLTTNMIPYKVLANTVNDPGFQLLFRDLHFYYRHDCFFFHRQENKIMITFKFAIGKMHKPLTLYKILTYPVPLNASSTYETSILDLSSHLAVTHDHSYYVEVQNDRLQTCSRFNHLIFCNYNLALFYASVPKCSYALFKDNREEVKSSRDFRFLPHELSSSLEQLNETHFLLYNIFTLNLQCTLQKLLKAVFFAS